VKGAVNDYAECACVDRAGDGRRVDLIWMGTSAFAEPKASDYSWLEFWSGEVGAIGGGALGYLMSSRCVGYSCIGVVFRWMNVGRALGASTLVAVAGQLLGVEGNIGAAYLATGLLWFGVSLLVTNLSILPGVPAALATIGYNIGAKMKSDKSKPAALSWQLPLVAWRF